jgi:hypothetical protein
MKLLKEQQTIDAMAKCYLLPHEFLYLVCNSEPRLDIINHEYTIDYRSQKGVIFDYELQGSKRRQTDFT